MVDAGENDDPDGPVINGDIIRIIAKYVQPSPITYCRLASVNRLFYHVFTSDKVWEQINPYGLESSIYANFLKSSIAERGLVKVCWSHPAPSDVVFQRYAVTENKYALLGAFGDELFFPNTDLLGDPVFVANLCRLKPVYFRIVRPHLHEQSNSDFYFRCGCPHIHPPGVVYPRPGWNAKEFYMRFFGSQPRPSVVEQMLDGMDRIYLNDPEIIESAKLYHYILVMKVDRELRPPLLNRYVARQSLEHYGPQFLAAFPEYRDDEYVVRPSSECYNGRDSLLSVIGDRLKNDPEIVANIVNAEGKVNQISRRLREMPEFIERIGRSFVTTKHYNMVMRRLPEFNITPAEEKYKCFLTLEYYRCKAQNRNLGPLLRIHSAEEYEIMAMKFGLVKASELLEIKTERPITNKEYAIALVREHPKHFSVLSPELRRDYRVFKEMCKGTDPHEEVPTRYAFDFDLIPPEFLGKDGLMVKLIGRQIYFSNQSGQRLKQDPWLLGLAMKWNSAPKMKILNVLSPFRIWNSRDYEIVARIVQHDYSKFSYLPADMVEDRQFVRLLMGINPWVFLFTSHEFRSDLEIQEAICTLRVDEAMEGIRALGPPPPATDLPPPT